MEILIVYKICFFIFSFFLNFMSLYFVIPILKKHSFLSKPNQRSAHQITKITGGGITFVLLSCLYGIILNFWDPIICFPLALIGFFDDRKAVHPFLRFVIQLITVLMLLFYANTYFNSLLSLISGGINFLVLILLGITITVFGSPEDR